MKLKRIWSLLLSLALMLGMLVGCENAPAASGMPEAPAAPNEEGSHSEAHEKIHSILLKKLRAFHR